MIQQDPRPAYQQGIATDRLYGISLYNLNVKWRIKAETVNVAEIVDIEWKMPCVVSHGIYTKSN